MMMVMLVKMINSRDLIKTVLESSIADAPVLVSPAKKGIRRKKCPEKWKRNAGKMYEKHTRGNHVRAESKMRPSSRTYNC